MSSSVPPVPPPARAGARRASALVAGAETSRRAEPVDLGDEVAVGRPAIELAPLTAAGAGARTGAGTAGAAVRGERAGAFFCGAGRVGRALGVDALGVDALGVDALGVDALGGGGACRSRLRDRDLGRARLPSWRLFGRPVALLFGRGPFFDLGFGLFFFDFGFGRPLDFGACLVVFATCSRRRRVCVCVCVCVCDESKRLD